MASHDFTPVHTAVSELDTERRGLRISIQGLDVFDDLGWEQEVRRRGSAYDLRLLRLLGPSLSLGLKVGLPEEVWAYGFAGVHAFGDEGAQIRFLRFDLPLTQAGPLVLTPAGERVLGEAPQDLARAIAWSLTTAGRHVESHIAVLHGLPVGSPLHGVLGPAASMAVPWTRRWVFDTADHSDLESFIAQRPSSKQRWRLRRAHRPVRQGVLRAEVCPLRAFPLDRLIGVLDAHRSRHPSTPDRTPYVRALHALADPHVQVQALWLDDTLYAAAVFSQSPIDSGSAEGSLYGSRPELLPGEHAYEATFLSLLDHLIALPQRVRLRIGGLASASKRRLGAEVEHETSRLLFMARPLSSLPRATLAALRERDAPADE